jgi:hypothetical protein
MMLMMMMMIAIAWASLQLFKSNVKEKQKHDVSMTSGLHQTMAAYKDAASKFTMEPLEPFKRVSHICFSCSIWPFWGSLQRLFRKLAVCSKQCWRSRFGGFLKWRYRKSSKSLDHDLVLEAMVTTGDPFFTKNSTWLEDHPLSWMILLDLLELKKLCYHDIPFEIIFLFIFREICLHQYP